MTQKLSAWGICSLLVMLSLFPGQGYCAAETPEQFLKNFYVWYITTDKGANQALKDEDIYRYVARETVEKIKNRPSEYGYDKSDYFLKMVDPPLSMSGVNIAVGKVTNMGTDTFVAPVAITVTFDGKHLGTEHVVVIFEKIGSDFIILKCMDIYPGL